MHAQGPHIWTVLRHLGDPFRKRTHVHLATSANELDATVFDDGEGPLRHIEYLPAFRHARLVQRQQMVALIALHWQPVEQRLGRLLDPLERRFLVAQLATGLLARCLPQGARLLDESVGRKCLLELLEFLSTFVSSAARRSHNVTIMTSSSPRVRSVKSGGDGFFFMTSMMNRIYIVYNFFRTVRLTLNSHEMLWVGRWVLQLT